MSRFNPIQDLIDEGALALYHDYRFGHCNDLSGNANHGVPSDAVFTNDGIKFPESTSVVTVSDDASLQLTNGCLVVLGDLLDGATSGDKLFSKRDAGGTNYELQLDSTPRIEFYDGTNTRVLNTSVSGDSFLAVNFSNGSTPEGFLDGVSAGSFNDVLSVSVDDADLLIGNYFSNSFNFKGLLKSSLITNRELTATEISELYAYLSAIQPSSNIVQVSQSNWSIDTSDPSLVGAWEMNPVENEIIDLSTGNHNGTIHGPPSEITPLGPALRFSEDDGHYVEVGSANDYPLTDLTVSFWMKAFGQTAAGWIVNYYFGLADAWGLYFDTSNNLLIYDDIDNAGATLYSTEIPLNKWIRVDAVMDSLENKLYIDGELVGSGTSSSDYWSSLSGLLYLGAKDSSGVLFNGLIMKPQIHNEAKSQAWITNEYNKGKTALSSFDFGAYQSVANTTSGYLENTPWIVDSGSFKISMDTVDGSLTKVIECVTSGIVYLPVSALQNGPSDAAFGEWEFWLNKADASSSVIQLFSDSIGAAGATINYNVIYNTDETVEVREDTATSLIDTDPTTFAHSTWHKFRVVRRFDGEFELFVNDTSYGTATDITTTTGMYIVWDADAGDKVAIASDVSEEMFYKRFLG